MRAVIAFLSVVVVSAHAVAQTPLMVLSPAQDALDLSIEARDLAVGETGEFILPDGQIYTVTVERHEAQSGGQTLWVGRLEGSEHRAIITRSIEGSFAYITTPEGAWSMVVPEAGAAPVLRPAGVELEQPEMDALQLDLSNAISVPGRARASAAPLITDGSLGNIDIAIVYTRGMESYYGTFLPGRLQHLVNVLDQALVNSQTGLRARLVGTTPVPTFWVEQTSTLETIDDLLAGAGYGHPGTSLDVTGECLSGPNGEDICNNDGDLSSLLAYRDGVGADVVVMVRRYWRAQQVYCGVAFLPGANAEGDIDPTEDHTLGVGVTGDGPDGNGTSASCGDLTFAHEVGHNLGSTHNIENASQPGTFIYSYGHRVDCNYRTIMAYHSSRSGVSCPGANESWLPYFSNPDIFLCQGQACGVAPNRPHFPGSPTDNTTAHTDNALSMQTEGFQVSAYRIDEPASLVSAVLPASRTVVQGQSATAFASIINPAGNGDATSCGLRSVGLNASEFSFQATDPTTNLPIGQAGELINIPEGEVRSFVFAITYPSSTITRDIVIQAYCLNRRPAPVFVGVNTLRYRTTFGALPDMIALAATASGDGIANLDENGIGAFAIASANAGAAGTVTVSPALSEVANFSATLTICQTDPLDGSCLVAPAPTVTLSLSANDTPTFSVFVAASGEVAFDPANNRVFVRFTPSGLSYEVGSTSVAVQK